tara:strand:+ start:4795 stop:4989 length:195 start_codon:yes stop_codon:yes gene_type:complete
MKDTNDYIITDTYLNSQRLTISKLKQDKERLIKENKALLTALVTIPSAIRYKYKLVGKKMCYDE